MKKLISIAVVFVSAIALLTGQTGDGSSSSPYNGIIEENTLWEPHTYSGKIIYASTLTIASGVTLTISPGPTDGGLVNFTTPGRSLTIEAGATVIINPRIGVTVNSITNNGTLVLESYPNEAGVASLLHTNYSGSGETQVKLYLSGGTAPSGEYKWHYVSVPMTGINATAFNTLNLAQYVETLVNSEDNSQGWVAYDGYQYSTGNTLNSHAFTTLSLGKGYNYYSASGQTLTFSGDIYKEDELEVAYSCGSGYSDYQGYNLLGNPFASCLNWDYMVEQNYLSSVNDAIYFTLNGLIASYVNGIGTDGATGKIPPMQGFFIKANLSGSIIIPRAARTHYTDQMRYKKSGEVDLRSPDTISFVRLKLFNYPDSTDLVVRFNKEATAGVDKAFDAYKFSKTSGDINIWTTTGGVAYSINGLPFPESTEEIAVGIRTAVGGTFKLLSNEIKRLDDYTVLLKDLKTGQSVDLKKGESIEFTSQSGEIEDRFQLVIFKTSTSISDIGISENEFTIYTSGGLLNIRYEGNGYEQIKGSLTLYDMSGRPVYVVRNLEWSGNGDLRQFSPGQLAPGLYLAELVTNSRRIVKKLTL